MSTSNFEGTGVLQFFQKYSSASGQKGSPGNIDGGQMVKIIGWDSDCARGRLWNAPMVNNSDYHD
jgi:hypothetical protein